MTGTEALPVDVLVIGGGPAGLAAAIECKRLGVATVFLLEREETVGGAPRHCGHPPFGMREFGFVTTGPRYARHLGEAAQRAGVTLLKQHSVVSIEKNGRIRATCPDGLVEFSACRVVLACGARETSRAARLISGDRPSGVLNTGAFQAALYLHGRKPFGRPVILGTELVSLSAVWSCVRAGIKPVAIIEERDRPTAPRALAFFPRLLGIPVHYGIRELRVVGPSQVEAIAFKDAQGTEVALRCDGLLLTGAFQPEASVLAGTHIELDPGSGGPLIDSNGMTSDPNVYAVGNMLRAIETAGWSFREGKRVAAAVVGGMRAQPSITALRAHVRIAHGPEIKYVVPGVWGGALHDGAPLQLRVGAKVKGTLKVKADGMTIWRRSIVALPERRILIPSGCIPSGSSSVWVGIE